MRGNTAWPFEAWLKIAVMQLGISPQEFWTMSLRDWFVLTKPTVIHPMTREDLMKLEDSYDTRN